MANVKSIRERLKDYFSTNLKNCCVTSKDKVVSAAQTLVPFADITLKHNTDTTSTLTLTFDEKIIIDFSLEWEIRERIIRNITFNDYKLKEIS